jgi:membrane associated rhomboid family serine protease
MFIHLPDPAYTTSEKSRKNFSLALRLAVILVATIWGVYLLDHVLPFSLNEYGLRPREWVGLLGIVTAPLFHSSIQHVSSNTFPLLIGATLMLYLYPYAAVKAFPYIYLGSGLLAWGFARPNNHIGASGLIYGVLAFVFVSGIVRKDVRSIAASMVIWFLYGSLVKGVVPSQPRISWELHAAGFVMGILTAIIWRQSDRPPYKQYEWENEPEESEDSDALPFWKVLDSHLPEEEEGEESRDMLHQLDSISHSDSDTRSQPDDTSYPVSATPPKSADILHPASAVLSQTDDTSQPASATPPKSTDIPHPASVMVSQTDDTSQPASDPDLTAHHEGEASSR